MSHLVTLKTQIRDAAALAAACARLGLGPPVHGTARLFAQDATGEIVQLPGWTYPLVVDVDKRVVHCNTYSGAWGEQKELDKLLQCYAVEKAKLEARKRGHSVCEQLLADGSIKLTIQVAGGGA